jgi:hypothetical protein
MEQGTNREISLGIGDCYLPRGQHICGLFSDDEERIRTLARFWRAGDVDDDKFLYITDTASPAKLARRFAAHGAGLGPESHASMVPSAATYYPEGRFDPEAATGALRDFCLGALGEGFAGARGASEMSWALRRVPGCGRLIEYELQLNDLFTGPGGLPMTVVCQYDTQRFDGALLMGLLEVHPFMLVRGQILRNPYAAASIAQRLLP